MNTQPTTQPTTQNTDATLMSFAERLRLSGLSLWEMGDLLGIHPHLLRGHSLSRLRDLPVSALIEIARRLDLHPADLIPELADVLGNQRKPPAPSHDGGPHDVEADARTVLTALATAAVPLAPDALAAALTWQLPRVQAALTHAQGHPGLAGPLALRRTPAGTFTLTPRLDLLTKEQHRAVAGATHHHSTLSETEGVALLRTIARNWRQDQDEYGQPVRDNDQHRSAIIALKHAGILYSDTGPHRVFVAEDVMYSLRYRPSPQADPDTTPAHH